jgi:signal transduction histidine kinase
MDQPGIELPGADALDADRLRQLLQIGRAIVAEQDLEALLDRVLHTACDITGARYAALGVLDEERQHLQRFLTRGVDEETRRAIGPLPRGRGVLGTLIRDPRPLRLRDVGEHVESWGFPAGHPRMTTFLGVPILVHGEAFGNIYLTEKDAGEFDQSDEDAIVVLAEWAAIAVSNAQSRDVVVTQRNELEHAVRRFEAMTEITRALGGETDLDRTLELIVKRGRALVHARSVALLVQDGDEVVVTAAAGSVDRAVLGERIKLEESISTRVLRTGRAERIEDIAGRAVRSRLATEIGAEAGLFVPLRYHGRVLGVLNAFDRTENGPGFGPEDEQLLSAFADSGAIALATARNVAAYGLRRSMEASERERSHWARELHDETLQDLGALAIRLATIRARAPSDELREAIDEAVQQARSSAERLRGLITELRPAALDQLGLQPALEDLAERMRSGSGLAVELSVQLGSRLSPELESVVYRVVQEALTNVVKHAAAYRCSVAVAEIDGALAVEIADEGAGFSENKARGGFGLLGMRERLALVGGRLEIDSTPGAGTRISASIPNSRPVDDEAGVRGEDRAAG